LGNDVEKLGKSQSVDVYSQFGVKSSMTTDSSGYLTITVTQSVQYIFPVENDFLNILGQTPRLPVDVYSIGDDGNLYFPVMNPTTSEITGNSLP
jgi:hypothetical protein